MAVYALSIVFVVNKILGKPAWREFVYFPDSILNLGVLSVLCRILGITDASECN